MGFSQGCATQVRWIHQNQPNFDRLILWAGVIPEDLKYTHLKDYFTNKEVLFVYGDQDQFLTEERVVAYQAMFTKLPFSIAQKKFSGKHEVLRDILEKI